MTPDPAPPSGQPRLIGLLHGRSPIRHLGGLRISLPDAAPLRWWVSSLRLRVVVVTLTLSALVLLGAGSYLYRQIADGLVSDRMAVASVDARAATQTTQLQFDRADQIDTSAQDIISKLVTTSSDQVRYVVFTRARDNLSHDPLLTRTYGPAGLSVSDIPEALREAMSNQPTIQHMQVGTVPEADGTRESAIFVGQVIQTQLRGQYGLYFIYPMTRERTTIALVGRWFTWGGALLALLVAAVAFVVTRLVVDPVRDAAATAERFAEGRFAERMPVHGADDLATLATSFNLMAESLQRQFGQLQDLSLVQQRFVSDVSHELRTPLTTIRMAADLIYDNRGEFDPMVRRSSELLSAQLDRFEALLADLLEISRFDAGAAALEVEAVDLRTLAAAVVEAHEPLAERLGSQIVVDVPDTPVVAELDSRRIERVLRNLVVNALEHGEGGPIEVRVAGDGTAVAVTVRDHGVGLKPGQAELVFDRFWRADPARARTTGGTGLGLSISMEDALLHGGRLDAWGMPGKGSCFRLIVARRQGEEPVTEPLPLIPVGERP